MITDEETFVLDEDCQGVTWRDGNAWHGCLRWSSGLGDTDHTGPFVSVLQARIAVRVYFRLWMNAIGEATP